MFNTAIKRSLDKIIAKEQLAINNYTVFLYRLMGYVYVYAIESVILIMWMKEETRDGRQDSFGY